MKLISHEAVASSISLGPLVMEKGGHAFRVLAANLAAREAGGVLPRSGLGNENANRLGLELWLEGPLGVIARLKGLKVGVVQGKGVQEVCRGCGVEGGCGGACRGGDGSLAGRPVERHHEALRGSSGGSGAREPRGGLCLRHHGLGEVGPRLEGRRA